MYKELYNTTTSQHLTYLLFIYIHAPTHNSGECITAKLPIPLVHEYIHYPFSHVCSNKSIVIAGDMSNYQSHINSNLT